MKWTTKQASDHLGFSNSSRVRQLCITGALKGDKVGRDWLIEEAEVRRYADSMQARIPRRNRE